MEQYREGGEELEQNSQEKQYDDKDTGSTEKIQDIEYIGMSRSALIYSMFQMKMIIFSEIVLIIILLILIRIVFGIHYK